MFITRITFLGTSKTNNNLSLPICYEILQKIVVDDYMYILRKEEAKEMYTLEMPLPVELIKSKP